MPKKNKEEKEQEILGRLAHCISSYEGKKINPNISQYYKKTGAVLPTWAVKQLDAICMRKFPKIISKINIYYCRKKEFKTTQRS